MIRIFFLSIFIFFVYNAKAQRDTIIYSNHLNEKSYPFAKQLAKKKRQYNRHFNEATIEEPWFCHKLFYVNGIDTLDYEIAKLEFYSDKHDGNVIYFTPYIDWENIIREVEIILIVGKPDLLKFKEFCSHLVAKPQLHFGLPDKSHCSYAIAEK